MNVKSDRARVALGAVRTFNGALALVAPEFMLRRLGADPVVNGVAIYPLRMFGIRTLILGLDSLWPAPSGEEAGGRILRTGVLIHLADALSAASAGLRHRLPARVAVVTTAISAVNTGLAVAAARSAAPAAREWTFEAEARSEPEAAMSRTGHGT